MGHVIVQDHHWSPSLIQTSASCLQDCSGAVGSPDCGELVIKGLHSGESVVDLNAGFEKRLKGSENGKPGDAIEITVKEEGRGGSACSHSRVDH